MLTGFTAFLYPLHMAATAQPEPLSEAGLTAQADAENLAWELGPTGTRASLRGLCAATDQVIWACGSGGAVIRSLDGGSSWTEVGPARFTELEFRSIHAWSEQRACIASAGTPAVILSTLDGGDSWQETYRHQSPQAFFDGLRFWDENRGVAFSDPVDGKLLIVETHDGGKSWSEIDRNLLPASRDGEAGFAASNSALALGRDGRVWIGTGGVVANTSRVFQRPGWEAKWQTSHCPIPSSAAAGIFSIARHSKQLVAVGGDYRAGEVSKLTAAVSTDDGASWSAATHPPPAYRSAVVAMPAQWSGGSTRVRYVTTGPTGSDISTDGHHWIPLNAQADASQGFHALATSPHEVFAVGSDGRFARLKRSQSN